MFWRKPASPWGAFERDLKGLALKHGAHVEILAQATMMLTFAVALLILARRPDRTKIETKDAIIKLVAETFDRHFDTVTEHE